MFRSGRGIAFFTLTVLGTFLLTGCSVHRNPVVLVEPSHSYLRDRPDAEQLSVADATRRLAEAPLGTAK